MSIKTAAQMFGDGAGNGAAVPYSTTNPPGTSAANRGIQFGEQLTAAIANRTHYALALNDEDLNTRLVPFETTGLDAAYRLGSVATPGGGRIIELDAGPVEIQSALATQYTRDRFNALIRANMSDDAVIGSVGVDTLAEYQQLPYANLVARRTQNLTGKSVSDPAAAVLNLGGANVAGISITGATTSGLLIMGVDLIEITNTAYAGIYAMNLLLSGSYYLVKLDGTSPTFTANTACSIRIWRQTFRATTRPSYAWDIGGTMIAGATDFNDTPALTLVPGAPFGVDSANGTGSRYALQVEHAPLLSNNREPVLQIDSLGTIRSLVNAAKADLQRMQWAKDWGVPAFYHRAAGDWANGYVGYSNTSYPYYGAVVQERYAPSSTVDLVGDEMTVGGSVRNLVAGQVVEITAPSSHAGFYVVFDGYSDPVIMTQLDGTSPGWTSITGGTMYPLEGVVLGRQETGSIANVLGTYDNADPAVLTAGQNGTVSSMRVHGPMTTLLGRSAANLVLTAHDEDNPLDTTYLRCFADNNEDFQVKRGGYAVARNSVQAPRVVAQNFQITPARVNNFYSLSPWSFFPTKPGTGLGAATGETSKWAYNDTGSTGGWQYSGSGTRMDLIIPITDAVPDGAIGIGGRLRYATFGSYVASSVVFQLITQNNGGSITVLDSVNLPLNASPTLIPMTFSSPIQADRGLGARYAYRIHVDSGWFASSAIFIFGADIDSSLNKL